MSAAETISHHYRVMRFEDLARESVQAIEELRWMDALRNLGSLAAVFTDVAADAAQKAFNEGVTKKSIADALGVTPATFRGMERTR